MHIEQYRDEANCGKVLRCFLPDADLIHLRLDGFDRAVLATPKESIADTLQDWQLIAFRLHQQKEKAD